MHRRKELREKQIQHHHPRHKPDSRSHSCSHRQHRQPDGQRFQLRHIAIALARSILAQLRFSSALVLLAATVLGKAQRFKIDGKIVVLQKLQHRILSLRDKMQTWPREQAHQRIAPTNCVRHRNVLIERTRTEKVQIAREKILPAHIRRAIVGEVIPFALRARVVTLEHSQPILRQLDRPLLQIEFVHQPAETKDARCRQHISRQEVVTDAKHQPHKHRQRRKQTPVAPEEQPSFFGSNARFSRVQQFLDLIWLHDVSLSSI